MPKAIDISGHKYGSLTALSFAGTRVGRNGRRVRQWVFVCDCGNSHICDVGSVRSGRTSSCGCKMINNLSGMEQ